MINFWIGLVLGLLIYHCANETSLGNIPFVRRKRKRTIKKEVNRGYRYNPAVKGFMVATTYDWDNMETSININKGKIGFYREEK